MPAVVATMPSPLGARWAPIDATLQREEKGDWSDDSDAMTDDASDASSTTTATKQVASSPCSVADVASSLASTPWATRTRPARRKRTRMSADERKVRHREVQRQFMKRKRARIAELRTVQAGVETQLRLVSAYHETEQLTQENDALAKHLEALDKTPALEATAPCVGFGDLAFSVPSEDEFMITACEWSELFDVLSDEAGVESD